MTSTRDSYRLLANLRAPIASAFGSLIMALLLGSSPFAQGQNCIQVYCPTNITVPCEGPWGAHVDFAVVATNICSSTQPTVTYSQPPGSIFPSGVTTVCATNSIPGVAPFVCCFTITVDSCCGTNCIKLICPPNMIVPCSSAVGGGFVDLSKLQPVLTNVCGGPIPSSLVVGCSPSAPAGGGPTFFPPGENTVICCVTNLQTGYIDCCCFKIFVPTNCVQSTPCHTYAICPTNVIVCVTNGPGTASVPFLTPVITNTCAQHPINVTGQSWTTPPGSFFPIGKTTVGVCVKWFDDFTGTSGTNCCCYDVVVICCTNPCDSVLKCPNDLVLDCPGPNGIQLFYPVFGTNSCYPQAFLDCTPTNGTTIFGNTNVCCKLEYMTPAGGLVVLTQCCFRVTVLCPSNCVPIINCPSNIFVTCPPPVFTTAVQGAYVPYPSITATDSCGLPVKIFCNPPSGSFFTIGCHPVTCVAVDSAGVTVSCHFLVCVLPPGCYLRNPSFEQLISNAPPPNNCGEPVDDAFPWKTLAGAPKLFRPTAGVPLNCWGYIFPCDGTNYAGISGGYLASGGFQTDAMMGRTVVPLNNGKQYRLRACLSLATNSPGPVVLVEFVLANYANPAQQVVVNQTWVQTRNFWQGIQPGPTPCFIVPRDTNVWDALIIRAAQVTGTGFKYPVGQVFVDNVNICCCTAIITGGNPTNPNLTFTGPGTLQFSPTINGIVDPMRLGDFMDGTLQIPHSFFDTWPSGFFRFLAPELDNMDCGCYP